MSVYGNILSAVQTALQTALPTASVRRRKRFVVRPMDQSFPLVLVVPTQDQIVSYHFEEGVQVRYRVGVCLILAGNQLDETNLDLLLDHREVIRKALDQPTLTGVSEVYNTTLELQPVYDLSALENNYEWSVLEAIYDSNEARN